jgi:hypothetical protein
MAQGIRAWHQEQAGDQEHPIKDVSSGEYLGMGGAGSQPRGYSPQAGEGGIDAQGQSFAPQELRACSRTCRNPIAPCR